MKARPIAFATLTLLCGFSIYAQEPTKSAFGTSKENAIEVCKPNGERAYLARLICPDNSHPTFNRIGSVGMRHDFPSDMSEDDQMKEMMAAMTGQKLGPGQADRHMIDGYTVQCGSEGKTLYLDMYHCEAPAPNQAPDGFEIIN